MWRIIAMMSFLAAGLLRLEPDRIELRGEDTRPMLAETVRAPVSLPRGFVKMTDHAREAIEACSSGITARSPDELTLIYECNDKKGETR